MNEFTVQVSNSSKAQTVTVTARNWLEAVDKAMWANMWATKGQVMTQNGETFPHSETIYY